MSSKGREPSFSLYDFKDWMSKQDASNLSEFFGVSKEEDSAPHEFVGQEAFPRVSKAKLMKKVVVEDADAEILIDEFVEEGGIIQEVDGKMFTIEVASGSFYLPRFCVTIQKPEDEPQQPST